MFKNQLLILLSLLFLVSCEKTEDFIYKKTTLKKEEAKKSYTMGYILGSNLKKMKSKLHTKAFFKGMKDSLKEKKPILSQQEMMNSQKQSNPQTQKQGAANMEEGQKFLENNKKNPNVKTTASGLQYEVLKEGTGKQPSGTSTVEVHYKGTLIDGTEFDSSYKRNQTISFPLNQVIKGWQEGVQLMKEGAKYKLYVPSELGYGARGAGASIPPNATLIFEIELIKVQ